MKLFSFLLIIFGILSCLFGAYHFWLKNNPDKLKFQNYSAAVTTSSKTNDKELPMRVIIKDVGIDVPLIPAKIIGNTWETTEYGASYLVSSPLPGMEGNSIIYAHNWASLFGELVRVVPGQLVEVRYADGSKREFIVQYTSVVKPEESDILAPSTDKRLTLYTCTGLFDTKRFVVVAFLDSKSAIISTKTRIQ